MPLTLQLSISSSPQVPPSTVTGGHIKAWFLDNVLNRQYDDLVLLLVLRNRPRTEIQNLATLASHGLNPQTASITLTVVLRRGCALVPFEGESVRRVRGTEFQVRVDLTPPDPVSSNLTGADIKSWILACFLDHRDVDYFSLFNLTEVIEIGSKQRLQDLNIDPLLSSPFVLKHHPSRLPLLPIMQINPQDDPVSVNELGIQPYPGGQRVSIAPGPGLDPSFTGPWAAPFFYDPGQSSSVPQIQNMGYPQFPVRPPGAGPSRSAGPCQPQAVEDAKARCRRAMEDYVMRLLSVENGVPVPDHTAEAFVREYLTRVDAHSGNFIRFLYELLASIAPQQPRPINIEDGNFGNVTGNKRRR